MLHAGHLWAQLHCGHQSSPTGQAFCGLELPR